MKIAWVLFNNITWLDLVGVYDPVTRLKNKGYLPDLSWDFCALEESVHDQNGLTVLPAITGKPLDTYDVVIVPGGQGTRTLITDKHFLQWLRTASNAKYKISICTGSLLLGAAGFLKDKKATTNYKEYERLQPFCKTVLTDRIVEDGDVITAGAVTASIDLGLYLCRKWAGEEAAREIRKQMDYRG
jgi:transcriptional regulator GlxA family with amidase domain